MSTGKPAPTPFQYFPNEKGTTMNEEDWLDIESLGLRVHVSDCSFDLEISGNISQSDQALECVIERLKSVLAAFELVLFVLKRTAHRQENKTQTNQRGGRYGCPAFGGSQ